MRNEIAKSINMMVSDESSVYSNYDCGAIATILEYIEEHGDYIENNGNPSVPELNDIFHSIMTDYYVSSIFKSDLFQVLQDLNIIKF